MPDYNGSSSYAPIPSTPPQAALSLLGDVNGQVQHAMGRVIGLTGTVRQLADAVFGSQPMPPETNAKRGGPSSRSEETRMNLGELHVALAALENEIARLSAIN